MGDKFGVHTLLRGVHIYRNHHSRPVAQLRHNPECTERYNTCCKLWVVLRQVVLHKTLVLNNKVLLLLIRQAPPACLKLRSFQQSLLLEQCTGRLEQQRLQPRRPAQQNILDNFSFLPKNSLLQNRILNLGYRPPTLLRVSCHRGPRKSLAILIYCRQGSHSFSCCLEINFFGPWLQIS